MSFRPITGTGITTRTTGIITTITIDTGIITTTITGRKRRGLLRAAFDAFEHQHQPQSDSCALHITTAGRCFNVGSDAPSNISRLLA